MDSNLSVLEPLGQHLESLDLRLNISTGMNSFREYLSSFHLAPCEPWDASAVLLAGYYLYLFGNRKVRYDTARKYLVDISNYSSANGQALRIPGTAMAIAKAWRRSERNSGFRITPKPTLKFEALKKLMNLSSPEVPNSGTPSLHNICLAVTLFGFFSLARLGELIGNSPPEWRDLAVLPTHTTIFLQRSKTDLSKCGAPISVPASIWKKVAALLKQKSVGAIFKVSKSAYNRWLVKTLTSIGHPPPANATVIGHSLRRGGAQHLWNTGSSLEEIKTKGRWMSEAWQKYIDLNQRIDSRATLF